MRTTDVEQTLLILVIWEISTSAKKTLVPLALKITKP
jgi:hypothetical protein